MEFTPDSQNREFQDALNLVRYTRQSVFLTGKAGTGKSTFLRYVCKHTKKKHVVLAPTGIAAINAGGSTLHSFFKLPFYPLLPDDPNFSLQRGRIHDFFKYSKQHRKLLEELELVIIDEISMVRADIIDAVDRILRVYSHNLREPFGGKQVLLVGDVFQLEPVVKADEREILNRFYPSPHFFSARVFSQIELVSIELQKVYRQTDPAFIGVLDHIRNNTLEAADLQQLNTRYGVADNTDDKDLYITLATRRDNVDYINSHKLAELPGEPVTFHGKVTGEFPDSSLPTSLDLTLKPGAQIIFVKNDFEKRWVNGTIGVVAGFDLEEEILYITTDDGKECDAGGCIANISLMFSSRLLSTVEAAFPQLAECIGKISLLKDAVAFAPDVACRLSALLREMENVGECGRIGCVIRLLAEIGESGGNRVVGVYRNMDRAQRRMDRIRTYVICNHGRHVAVDDVARLLNVFYVRQDFLLLVLVQVTHQVYRVVGVHVVHEALGNGFRGKHVEQFLPGVLVHLHQYVGGRLVIEEAVDEACFFQVQVIAQLGYVRRMQVGQLRLHIIGILLLDQLFYFVYIFFVYFHNNI